jgi:anthranilate/para-aminobenzoate synthase component I
MSQPISILTTTPEPGPDPLDLLDFLCKRGHSEITLLHSATATSHSVIGLHPLITLEIDEAGAAHEFSDKANMELDDNGAHPLETLESFVQFPAFTPPHPLIGWLGFISYDIAHTLENIPPHATDDLHWPLLRWTLYNHYLLHDPTTRQWTAISLNNNVKPLQELLRAARHHTPTTPPPSAIDTFNVPDPATHRSNIEKTRAYIAAGDIYQANIAQRWQIPTHDPPNEIYRRLCAASPAPYAAFFQFTSHDGTDRHILSASPELFITAADRRIVTRPIKGTRRRDTADPVHDARLRDDLLISEKDQAELAMIVDLLRNDLGRIADFGTVKVDAARDIERHPTVWHTVATINATLRENAGLADILRALCPGGSITGAPKIRAMQIIEELEKSRRGLYCGNIGVIGPQAKSLTLNIAIRTILLQNGIATLHAGGGIVADSNPSLEHQESLDKAAALLHALGVLEAMKNINCGNP